MSGFGLFERSSFLCSRDVKMSIVSASCLYPASVIPFVWTRLFINKETSMHRDKKNRLILLLFMLIF